MKKPARTLRIPTPCTENWDDMTDAARGKFCSHCSKQVIDFSYLPDPEIIRIFENKTEKICGRFTDEQMNRPLMPAVKAPRRGQGFLAGLLLLSATEAIAGSPTPLVGMEQHTDSNTSLNPAAHNNPALLPKDSTVKKNVITGKITDDRTHKGVRAARITIHGSGRHSKTNKKGEFRISVKSSDFDEGYLTIQITGKGYTIRYFPVKQSEAAIPSDIPFSKKIRVYGETFLD